MSRGNWLSEKGSDSGVAQGGVSHGLTPCRALERVQRAATADKRGCRSVVFAPVDWVLLQRDHCQIVLSVVLGEGEEGRDGKGWMQGDMLVGRARNPTTYSTSLPTHNYPFPARSARAPTARHCCGSHGNGGSARPSGGVGKLPRHLLCSGIVGTLPHDHKAGSRTRPQMLGRGALDVSVDDCQHVCVLHVCTCVCSLTGQRRWWKAGRMLSTRLLSCRGLRSTVGTVVASQGRSQLGGGK